MSQKNSGYARKPFDLYSTPAWCTEIIVPYLRGPNLWEPARGDGHMVEVLRRHHFCVYYTDIAKGDDFLEYDRAPTFGLSHNPRTPQAIVTNPPYSLAQEFVRKALELMAPVGGQVAMLLRVDFDSAKTRRDLFQNNPAWGTKIVFLDRIKWFEGESKKTPSENHAFFLWDFQHTGEPRIHYATRVLEDI